MDNFFIETSSLVSVEEQPNITSNYQAPTIEVYDPNHLTQSAETIQGPESEGAYYS